MQTHNKHLDANVSRRLESLNMIQTIKETLKKAMSCRQRVDSCKEKERGGFQRKYYDYSYKNKLIIHFKKLQFL